jgi:hypothetical protein
VSKYLKEQFRHGFWRVKMYLDHPIMAKGDDYTFWKDILEVPLVLFILGLWVLVIVLDLRILMFVTAVSFLLFFLEVAFSLLMVQGVRKVFFFAGVMFARSFSRTFGFLGGALMSVGKIFQKS